MSDYILAAYLILLNIAGFVLMGIDKHKAKKQVWRIREKTLFLTAFLGGSMGSILGMKFFRHKTRHKRFLLGMPLILVFHCCIIWLIFT